MSLKNFISFTLLVALLFPATSFADVTIRISRCESKNAPFIFELLTTALKETSPETKLTELGCFPHLRQRDMLKHGELDVVLLIQSDEYDKNLIPIRVPVTNGLISQRVLVVSKSKTYLYKGIQTLDEFRALNLVGAFGKNWFDCKVWTANDLKYETMANWKLIYPQLSSSNRSIDYFSRSVLEAAAEIQQYPELTIVPNLLFSYNKNIFLYLSTHSRNLKPVLEKAMSHAQSSGLIDRLLQKHYKEAIESLNLHKRTLIHLETPQ